MPETWCLNTWSLSWCFPHRGGRMNVQGNARDTDLISSRSSNSQCPMAPTFMTWLALMWINQSSCCLSARICIWRHASEALLHRHTFSEDPSWTLIGHTKAMAESRHESHLTNHMQKIRPFPHKNKRIFCSLVLFGLFHLSHKNSYPTGPACLTNSIFLSMPSTNFKAPPW